MFGYATRLRSMSQGRAIYSMEFNSYAQVSPTLAKELIARFGGTYKEA
jgi:elongation factor G